MLGLLALLGFMAIAARVQGLPEFAAGFKRYGNNFSIPAVLLHAFPGWFVGLAFAAIAIGALWLQLLGGIWMIQTAPSVLLALYTRMLNGWALLIGWAAGFVMGTWMAVANNFAPVSPLHPPGLTVPCYIAISSVVLNVVVSVVLSPLLNAVVSDRHKDMTAIEDYA